MTDGLPQGWDDVLLTDVAAREKFAIVDGPFGSDLKLSDYVPDGTVPVLTTKNLTGNYNPNSVRFISREKFQQVKRSKVVSGDILIAKIGSIGKCSIYPEGAPTAIIPANLCKITVDDQVVFNRYLYWQVRTDEFQNMLRDITSATAQPAFSVQRLKTLSIKLAPLVEQQRIVAKLEKLLGGVDACQKRLAKIPVLLKRFRQSVLAAACSGELTEDWREESKAAIVGQTSKPNANLPEIPESWRWVKLPDTGNMSRGKSRHRPRNEPSLFGGSYPFIQTGDIAQSGGRITNHKQTYSEAGLAQSRLWPTGTICITIAANIAESAILTYPACFPDSVVGIIANTEISVAEYVEFFIRVAKADLATFAPATAQKNINIGILNEVQVPLPPLPEQQEIVRRVERLFALADNIEQRYKKAQAFIDKLTPSLLAKAFRGELVPQDPNDEPASVLLERIKAERQKKNPQDRRKRG